MIALRRADARGHFDFGWLDTRHTFSFGEYYDPNQMGFRTSPGRITEPVQVLVFDRA